MCCVGTYGKQAENIGFALEPMQNKRKTHVVVTTSCIQMENTCVAYEPIENQEKTKVSRRNLWKTQRTHSCCVGACGKHMENYGFA